MKGRVIQVNKTEREVLSKGNNVNTTSEARHTMACFNTPRTQMHEVRLKRRDRPVTKDHTPLQAALRSH